MGMNSVDYGFITSVYGLFNVFLFMLLMVEMVLDKFGVRYSAIASALIMIVGGVIKHTAFKDLIGSPDVPVTIPFVNLGLAQK